MTLPFREPRLSLHAIRGLFRGTVGVGVVAVKDAGAFKAGRQAASAAMADLGTTRVELPRGPSGEPEWPPGVTGSIAHTKEVAIAVTAWAAEFEGLGVDIEVEGRHVDPRTARRICTAEEASRFTQPEALLALFCAKEATYKALAPLGAARLGFQEVAYTETDPGLLVGRIVNDAVDARVPRTFTARYAMADGFVVAAVQIDRRG